MTQFKSAEPNKLNYNVNKVENLRRIAFLLDNSISIPGTQVRFGLDPLLGLLGIIGGSGDVIGGAMGVYIVSQAAQMGVPSEVIWKMVGNILLDSLIGLVPALGDILDFAWKANSRNIALLDQYLNTDHERRQGNPFFTFGVTVVSVIIVISFAFLTLAIIRAIFQF